MTPDRAAQSKSGVFRDADWLREANGRDSSAFRKAHNRRYFVIETREGKPIGIIALVHINTVHGTAEIYIVISQKEFWGKGVMLEAESLLIDWAFNFLKLEKIWADAVENNIASIITMKKLSFQIEGMLRKERFLRGRRIDVIRLGLLKEEFKA